AILHVEMRRLILLSLLAALACARYVDNVREKRDIEAHDWLTEAQKSELKALKESADGASLKKRTMELYELLPAAEKEKWNGKYKEMCVAWIKEVATEEETENYKKWKAEGKMEEITSQYKKLKERLSEHKRKDVELWENECWSLWKDEFPASRGRRSVMDLAEEKLAFLGAEKIAELKALKESGANDDVIRDKVVSWTLEHWKSSDSKVSTADFVKKCYGWIKDVTQAEEYAAFEKLHHTDHEACRAKVKEFLARLPAEKQSQVEKSLPLCDAIWYKQHQEEHGAHEHEHHAHKHHVKRHLNTMHIEKYMGWLSQEQKDEIKKMEAGGESYETLLAKMKGWYDALESRKKSEVREDFKDKCAGWVFAKTTETEQYDLQEFIQMGDKDGLLEYLKKIYARLTDDEKHEVDHTKDMCIAVWTTAPERKRRDHHHHEEYKEYFTWLTPEQAAEVKTLRDAEKHDEAYAKTNEFYGALAGDKKTEATEKLKGACKHFFKNSFGEAAVEEIKNMKESGSSMDDIAKKVEEFIGKVTDEKKKEVATRASVNCKKVFSASRRRRDQPDQHEEYKPYFTWLTAEQGAEIKALRDAEKHDEAYAKTNEFYGALEGDKKTEATEKLKGACKHFFKSSFGDAAVEEIKNMKESGSSMDDITKKVDEFIGKVTDDEKKAAAMRVTANCKKVFSASRRRRDHHDEYAAYKEYFTWLTPDQVAEVKKLREAGDEDGANKKVHEFYDALTGDKKTEATEKLKGACKHFFKDTFGEAAVEEFKAMKESGSSVEDITKKVEELVGKITDEKKKATATKATVNCKKMFSASRKRREHQDEYAAYHQYFTWLTPDQAAEVKKLKEAGDDEGINTKVHEYYAALSGDKKTEATEKLKGSCRHYFKDTFGEAAVEEFKAFKESGTSVEDIAKKVDELVGKITDEKKQVVAARAAVNCKKLFGASRKRREHNHNIDEAMTEFLPWLSDEQKAELKGLKESGAEEKIGEKIMEYFDSVDASKKDEARTKLQAGCKHFLKHLIGDAAAEEMKALKETGATDIDMAKKLEEIISKMPEGVDKTKAIGMSKNCKKVYGVASRKRRHEHSLEEGFTEFLPWITDDQKMELKNMKEAGAEEKMGDKIMEYFDSVDASKKDEARSKLQAGCRHYLKDLLGDVVAGEMKQMHEAGSSPAEMAKKLDQIIGNMDDGEKKAKATRLSKNCRKVYGVEARKRRNTYGEYDERYQKYYNWLKDEQRDELAELQDSGEDDVLLDKISQYFKDLEEAKKEEARGQLKMGCRMRMRDLLGEERSEEIRRMKDEGATKGKMLDKVAQFVEAMEEGTEKERARRSYRHCAKILGRQRREAEKPFNLAEHTAWLKPEQRNELNSIIRSQQLSSDDIYGKLFEYLNELEEDEKVAATMKMRAACRYWRESFIGRSQSEKLKQMKQTGKKWSDIEHTMDGMIAAIEDASVRSKAQAAIGACKHLWINR
ncbi:hypothetical protein PENTCL1PPCAC_283, partial [Pristionchus entomophagus]